VKLRVATRGSALALWQTEWVVARLRELHGTNLEVEVVTIRTRGDQIQNVPIAQIGGKGIFVKEIEQAILSGEADFGVHSLKDMPADQPTGLAVVAVPEREDPRDALVLGRSGAEEVTGEARGRNRVPGATAEAAGSSIQNGYALNSLASGASVGTTSRRRGAQLLHERPDVRIEMLRGNLDTRLRKLDMGQHDAIILAAAGLRRLGFADRISQILPVEHFVPCAGQGALAIEARADDLRVRSLLEPLQHPPSALCVRAEREVLRRLGASCHTPLGAHAWLEDDTLQLHGMLASPDGAELVRVSTHAAAADPEAAGRRLADLLIESGGERILASLEMSGEG
jgi:hydroxymethylbilane synthase